MTVKHCDHRRKSEDNLKRQGRRLILGIVVFIFAGHGSFHSAHQASLVKATQSTDEEKVQANPRSTGTGSKNP